MVDPNIALQFRSPQVEQVSPLQSIGALMALRGQMAEIPLRLAQAEHARQQAAQEAIVTEQKQRQLQDEGTLKELMSDPVNGPKIASGDLSPLNGKVNYDFQQGIAKNVEEIHKNAALASKDDLANKSTALNALAEGIQGLGEDPAQINANLTAFKSNPANQLLFKNAGIDPSTIPTLSDAADLRKWEAGVGVAQAVTNKALALKESKAKEAETEANTAKTVAETERQNLLNQALRDSANYNPAAGGVHPIDKILDPVKYPQENASYRAAFDTAMRQPPDQNGRRPAIDTILEQASAHAASLSPALIANKAATAKAEETARSPIIQNRELTVASANRKANEDLTARGEYERSLMGLNSAVSDAERIHNLISAAQGGNKAAPGVIPIAELRTFITRPNIAELRAVGGAGDWADKVEGFVKGATEGQPIPPDVLHAMDELSNLAVKQAEQKHSGEVTSINTARSEHLKPLKAADLGYTAPGAGVPTPATQAEFNALPTGAQFKKPNDPKVYVKQ